MAWANFMILGLGGALLTVPVVLHFLMQPKPKRVDLPTLRFLQERQRTTRSRMRLRHLLLLLLRCLLIALAALAMAGPAVASRDFGNWLTLGGIGLSGLVVGSFLLATLLASKRNLLLASILGLALAAHLAFGGWSAWNLLGEESNTVLGDAEAPIAALVVIDTSPRMTYRQNNATRLERAQQMADWLVQQFPDDSRVCVLATDYDEPFFSVDTAAAARRIEKLEIDFVPASIPETLNDGLALLDSADQERKEVYVLTDLTQAGWQGEGGSAGLSKRLERFGESPVMVVDVGQADVTNFSLAPLRLSAAEITETSGLVVSTEINRLGGADQRTLQLAVEQPDSSRPVMRDGQALYSEKAWQQQATVDVRENGVSPVEFRFKQTLDPGTYHGQISIVGADSLELDDTRHFTFQVSQQWKTLVIAPDSVSTANLISTIAPARAVEVGRSLYDCEVVNLSEIDTIGGFERFEAVFLLDPLPISEGTWQRLTDYARAGGGVAIFLGDNAAAGQTVHESFRSDSAVEAMGIKLTRPWRSGDEDWYLSPNDSELAHPLFQSFRRFTDGIPWNRFPIRRHWGIEKTSDRGESDSTASVLLRYSNRRVALVEHRVGNGRVFTMTTPISEPAWSEERTVWNDLFLGKPLPAWLLVRAIAQQAVANDSQALNLLTGQTASFANDLRAWPESYRVFTPDAERSPDTLHAIDNRVRIRSADRPGHYRFRGQLEGPVLRGFSTQLPADATDLTRLQPDQLDAVLGADRYQIVQQRDEIHRQQGTNRRGQEFYPLLMLMLLVAMSVEQLIANQFYRT